MKTPSYESLYSYVYLDPVGSIHLVFTYNYNALSLLYKHGNNKLTFLLLLSPQKFKVNEKMIRQYFLIQSS